MLAIIFIFSLIPSEVIASTRESNDGFQAGYALTRSDMSTMNPIWFRTANYKVKVSGATTGSGAIKLTEEGLNWGPGWMAGSNLKGHSYINNSNLSDWVSLLNGNYDFVRGTSSTRLTPGNKMWPNGYPETYDKALLKDRGSYQANSGPSVEHKHIRSLSGNCGASITGYTEGVNGYLNIQTTKKPLVNLVGPDVGVVGKQIQLKLSGTSFAQTVDGAPRRGIKLELYEDGKLIKTFNQPSKMTHSESYSMTPKYAGKYYYTLRAIDAVQRQSDAHLVIDVGGGTPKPEPVGGGSMQPPPPGGGSVYVPPKEPPPPPEPEPPQPNNRAPVAVVTYPEELPRNYEYAIIDSSYDSDGFIVERKWEIPPGCEVISGLTNAPGGGKVKFSELGEYKFSLTVTDNGVGSNGVPGEPLSSTVNFTIKVINIEPEARFTWQEEPIQGDDVIIRDYSYDVDGEIVERKWEFTPNDGVAVEVEPLGEEGGKVYFDKPGEVKLKLTVKDNDGMTDTYEQTTNVKPAIPIAYIFDEPYSKKQNRLVTFYGEYVNPLTGELVESLSSTSSHRYPIVWEQAQWSIEPITEGIDPSSIKIREDGDLRKRQVVFKEPGRYKATLKVINTAGHWSEPYETEFEVKEDKPPVADFFVLSAFLRDVDEDKPHEKAKATISLICSSYSPDGDDIAKRVWKYKYDSNNNGSFDDESWQILSSGNETEPSLTVEDVGRYYFELEVTEGFDGPTLPEFITEDDYLKGNTDNKLMNEKVTEVINISPIVSFDQIIKPKVDVVFTIGDTSATKKTSLENNMAHLKAQLEAAGFDTRVSFVEAVKEVYINGKFSVNVWWAYDGYDMDSHVRFYNSSGDMVGHLYYGNKNMYGCSLDLDDTRGGIGEWLTFDFSQIPSNITEIRLSVNPYRGSSRTFIRLYKENLSGGEKQLVIEEERVVSGSETYFGKLVRNGEVWDFIDSNNKVISGKIIEKQITTLDEVMPNHTWRVGSYKFVADLHDTTYQTEYLDKPLRIAVLFGELLSREIDLSILGTPVNQTTATRMIQLNDNEGTFILNNNNMLPPITSYGEYIINKVKNKQDNSNYLIVNEDELEIKTAYSDAENDPWIAERWMYTHNPDHFENPMGLANYHDVYIPNPVVMFDKTGSYEIGFQRRDNPKNDNRFDNYRLWSVPLEDEKLKVFVHRKPVPQFTFKLEDIGTTNKQKITIAENSFDLDNESKGERGIARKEWYWKEATSTTWIAGKPTEIEKNKSYLVKLIVEDFEGVVVQDVKAVVNSDNMPPVAKFIVDPNPAIAKKPFTITDLSYDPNGDIIVEWNWRVRTPANVWQDYGSTKPVQFDELGLYVIELKAKDEHGLWSEPYLQDVMVNNLAPVAQFTMNPNPAATGETVTFTDTSYDPNGDNIVERKWTLTDPLGNETEYINSMPPSTYTLVGDWIVTLEVKDEHGLWSAPTSRILIILNTPPHAQFTMVPNPAKINEIVTFTNLSWDTDGHSMSFDWDITREGYGLVEMFSDGVKNTPYSFTKSFDIEGKYFVRLVATDEFGAKGETIHSLIVWTPLEIVDSDLNPNPAQAGIRITATIQTDGYAESVKLTYNDPKLGIQVVNLKPSNVLPSKVNTWTGRFRTSPWIPDGAYPVYIEANRSGVTGISGPQTETKTLILNIEGTVYDDTRTTIKN